MIDNYSNSYEVGELLIGSVHSNAFNCTSDDALTCTLSNSGVIWWTWNYLTANTFWPISSEWEELASTILGLEPAKDIEAIGELCRFIDKYWGISVLYGKPIPDQASKRGRTAKNKRKDEQWEC